jgi:hypothetical protein
MFSIFIKKTKNEYLNDINIRYDPDKPDFIIKYIQQK